MVQHSDEVDRLLHAVMPQAPEGLHQIFALEGACEVLLRLSTAESKVAYLVRNTAVELYQASKAIDAKNISSGPNDLQFHILRSDDVFASYPYKFTMRDLGELEDLYYAACAKIKELLQGVDILLSNGFRGADDIYFTYRERPLHDLGPISIGAFKRSMLIHESVLYSSELRSVLNKGVIEKNSRGLNHEFPYKVSLSHSTPQDDAQHGNQEATGRSTCVPKNEVKQALGWAKMVKGLQDKSNMSCGMVFGELAEKYRPTGLNTELGDPTTGRRSTPETPQALLEESLTRDYISPYNLNERAKKLNVPGGPEMPCICDPECVCVPLCASDLSQNCLCEENGLFVRVTEGMDIDDLDVPDLVRRKRQLSEASESRAASSSDIGESFSTWPIDSTADIDAVTPSDDQYHLMYGDGNQVREQKVQEFSNVAVPIQTLKTVSPVNDFPLMRDMLELSGGSNGLFWQDRLGMPSLRMSDFSHYELTQPFSKQCDHPPRRQSVTERLFKSKFSNKLAYKKYSPVDQLMQRRNINSSTVKVTKQLNKRSLADISFTSLRFARRRGS